MKKIKFFIAWVKDCLGIEFSKNERISLIVQSFVLNIHSKIIVPQLGRLEYRITIYGEKRDRYFVSREVFIPKKGWVPIIKMDYHPKTHNATVMLPPMFWLYLCEQGLVDTGAYDFGWLGEAYKKYETQNPDEVKLTMFPEVTLQAWGENSSLYYDDCTDLPSLESKILSSVNDAIIAIMNNEEKNFLSK